MATIFEGLFPAIIPQRGRPHDSIEVIDVDELDEEEIAALQRPLQRRDVQPPQQHIETISLLDSDDDEPQIVASSSTSQTGASHSRLRSLPPPPQRNDIPPVPPIPRRLAGHQSFVPMRHRPPPHPDGLIRPSSRPFEFEAHMQGGPSTRRTNSNGPARNSIIVPLRGAEPSHHVPVMGFGGAILQLRNQRESPERRVRRGPRVQRPARTRHFYSAFDRMDDHDIMEPPSFSEWNMLMHVLDAPEARKEIDYSPHYTHSVKPEAGFMFDFASDDAVSDISSTSFPVTSSENPIVLTDEDTEVGPSSSVQNDTHDKQMKTLLVCACCSKPLLLNSHTSSKGPAEERKRRIWALRCGHLIDGECLDNISTPVVPSPDAIVPSASGKNKGKAKAADPEDEPGSDGGSDSADGSDDDLIPAPRYPLRHRAHHLLGPGTNDYDTYLQASNYPLRSRPLHASLAAPLGTSARRGRAKANTTRSRRGKKQQIFEWLCPVAGCEQTHASVRSGDGGWEPEKDSVGRGGKVIKPGRGVIAVFA
ncbi:hypothetical protein BDN71DRAFT_1441178 [Pleurotus eryngii]|uniref:Uncharacterized protein n=1 Tax=Pleurotus eryngii TaxID=5323 RepID=A0A9P6DCV1_PLEER|nr:hypothetical protein BDN71DRAFT_1441178 [Pleurotus eryngii]